MFSNKLFHFILSGEDGSVNNQLNLVESRHNTLWPYCLRHALRIFVSPGGLRPPKIISQGQFMLSEVSYRVNSPQVILETFADEVVIVNLESGNYYSIDKVGAEIWALLAEGASVPQIVSRVGRRYAAPEAEIDCTLRAWVEQLLSENLLVPAASAGAPQPPTSAQAAEKLPFEPPVLQKYTDMQELLLLDPIHEVDDTGWPNIKPDAA
jgi:hypothetical protein